MLIRAATTDDLPMIRDIFNAVIATTTASFTTVQVDLANRQAWMASRVAAGFPVLVAEAAGRVAGFASYGPFRSGAGYDATVEHSVHVAPEMRGQGIGRQLMRAIIADAFTAGRHVMIGAIDGDNAVSLALHDSMGFQRVGHLPAVGAKFGRWLDLVLVQLVLNVDAPPPGPAP
jgi:L-amino acid N-acyltransferase